MENNFDVLEDGNNHKKWKYKFHTLPFSVILVTSLFLLYFTFLFKFRFGEIGFYFLLYWMLIAFLSGLSITLWVKKIPVYELLLIGIFQFPGKITFDGIFEGIPAILFVAFLGAFFGIFFLKILHINKQLNKNTSILKRIIIFIISFLIIVLSEYYLKIAIYNLLFDNVFQAGISSAFASYFVVGILCFLLFKRFPIYSLISYIILISIYRIIRNIYLKMNYLILIDNIILMGVVKVFAFVFAGYVTYKIYCLIKKNGN